jgi:hypothetical protein
MVGRRWYQSLRHVAFVQHNRMWFAGVVQVALQKAVERCSCATASVSFAGHIARRMLG